MGLSVQTRNDALFEEMIPFLVATPNHLPLFDRAPFGLRIPDEAIIDPTKTASERFLLLLQTLDRLTFGPEGMPMPRWVFYDCAEIPGAIFGLARKPDSLPSEVRERMGLEWDEPCLVPFSMWVAIPVRPPGFWFGHNLASLNPVFPTLGLRGLASVTKALGMKVFRCQSQIGATQWDSEALHIHSRFGPLDLVTAWTPAHSEAATLTYRFDVTDEKLRHVLGDKSVTIDYPEPTLEIPPRDEALMRQLQQRIESQERFVIAGPPKGRGEEFRVPVAALDP